jgi:hypothetical protein
MMMHSRPLTLRVGHGNVVLEQECPVCGGTNKWPPDAKDSSLPCNFCAGGYIPSLEGEAILQLVLIHFEKIIPNIEVLTVLTDHFSVRP